MSFQIAAKQPEITFRQGLKKLMGLTQQSAFGVQAISHKLFIIRNTI